MIEWPDILKLDIICIIIGLSALYAYDVQFETVLNLQEGVRVVQLFLKEVIV